MENFNLAAVNAGSKSGCPVLGHHKHAGKYNFDFFISTTSKLTSRLTVAAVRLVESVEES